MKLIRKMFSKKEEKHEVKLGKSVRGVGRSIAGDGISGASALGRGKKAADKAAKEGKSEAEVIDEAGKKAKKTARAIQMGKAAVAAGISGAAAKKIVEEVTKEHKGDALKLTAKILTKSGEENPEAKKAIRKAVTKIVKNPGKTGAAVAAALGAGVLAHGAAKAFKKGRLAENTAHKNTIERIKDGKKEEKKNK